MTKHMYRDLREYGLPFITPNQPSFAALVADIRTRAPWPLPDLDLRDAAVLLNESGRAILGLSVPARIQAADYAPRVLWRQFRCPATQSGN